MLIHELSVGSGHNLESFVHRLLCWKEGRAEVQGALLLAETTSGHEDNARLIQDLFVQRIRSRRNALLSLLIEEHLPDVL